MTDDDDVVTICTRESARDLAKISLIYPRNILLGLVCAYEPGDTISMDMNRVSIYHRFARGKMYLSGREQKLMLSRERTSCDRLWWG